MTIAAMAPGAAGSEVAAVDVNGDSRLSIIQANQQPALALRLLGG